MCLFCALFHLEAVRDEAEARLACEKMASTKVSEEFMRFWLHRFRKLDVKQQNHRQMLIDSFINAIYLYDDKIVITFNYKEETKTVTFNDVKASLSEGKVRIWMHRLYQQKPFKLKGLDGFFLFIFN